MTGGEGPETIDDIMRAVRDVIQEHFQSFSNFPTSGALLEGTARISSGLYSALPAAGTKGRLYHATDTDQLLRDNESAWVEMVPRPAFVAIPLYASDKDYNSINDTSWATLPIGETWASGEGILVDADSFPSGAKFRTQVMAVSTIAISTRVYDATLGGVVSGSEKAGSSSGAHVLRSDQFSLASGERKLRLQAKCNSWGGARILMGLLEVNL